MQIYSKYKEMKDIIEEHKTIIKEKEADLEAQAKRIKELEQQLEATKRKS